MRLQSILLGETDFVGAPACPRPCGNNGANASGRGQAGAPTKFPIFFGKENNIMKKLVAAFLFLSLLTVLIAACGGTVGSSGASDTNGTDVHMGDTNFVQSSVTVTKGSSFNLINDTNVVHIIQNGTWSNNN